MRVRWCAACACALVACTPNGDRETSSGERPGGSSAEAAATDAPEAPVRAGVEVLLTDSLHLLTDRRVGLITNHTGIFRAGRTRPDPDSAPAAGRPAATTTASADDHRSTIDALFEHPDVELVALFGPEHGLRGDAEAGERVEDGTDPRTGLPVHSLYSSTRSPPPEALEGLDVLVFDIQDVGARYYTYVYTMALAMEAAGEAGLPFVVLDRPNPIGGDLVQGNVLDPAFSSFVGMYPVPMRHGMTPGELARMYVGEFGVEVQLHVVPAEGWTREMPYEATELPWVAPSPNMPSVESALHYPGTCLFEGTNLSVGRGTERAFQWIGAPWIDGVRLAGALNGYRLPGVRFEAVTFTPQDPGDGKFPAETVNGVRFVETRTRSGEPYDPTKAAVAALLETRRMSGERWRWREGHFDRLAGTDRLRTMIEEGRSLEEIVGAWDAQVDAFEARRAPYLIYPGG